MEKHDGHEKEGRHEILMGRTSTTRPKGNGPGHGGPARGASASGAGYGPGASPAKSFAADHQPSGEAKSAGHEIAAEIRARIAARKEEIIAAQFSRALDPMHPQGHAAAKDLLDRIAPPETKQTVSGDADAPLAFTIVTGVPRAED
ncbi:MAG: hypothetical protein ACK5X3_18900 [Pseudomonadota bacterium]